MGFGFAGIGDEGGSASCGFSGHVAELDLVRLRGRVGCDIQYV